MARPVAELLGRSGLLSGAAVPNARRLALPLAALAPSRRLPHRHHHRYHQLHQHHNHHLRTGPLSRGLGSARAQRRPASTSSARRPGGEPLYPDHIVTTGAQKTLLAVGSAVTALLDPSRHDMVAALGETTAGAALVSMRDRMAADPVGASILADRPRVSEAAVDMPRLRGLAPDTFGRKYADFMDGQGISADTRMPVRFVDDEELAYVAQRYREIHDFVHLLLDFSTISEHDEIAVKWFEAAQTGLPMCYLSGLFGPLRLTSREKMQMYTKLAPWAMDAGRNATFLLNVYYEQRFDVTLDELREELNIKPPPHGHWDQ